jgi:hypothetical protein
MKSKARKEVIQMDDYGVENSINIKETPFVAVPITEVVMQICEGVMKLKHAQASKYSGSELVCKLQSENFLTLDLQKLGVDVEAVAKERIRLSQVQLFLFLLYAWRNFRNAKFTMDLTEFYELRDLTRRSENQKRITEDLEVLQAISISINGKNKKQTYYANGSLLQYKKVGRDIQIEMGDWIQHLSPKGFTALNKKFFCYHAKHEWIASMLSVKFAQLNSLDKHKVKIETLINYLGITNEQIKKQGVQYYTQLLNNAFSLLSKEGYQFTAIVMTNNEIAKFTKTLIAFHYVDVLNVHNQVGSDTEEVLSDNKAS